MFSFISDLYEAAETKGEGTKSDAGFKAIFFQVAC